MKKWRFGFLFALALLAGGAKADDNLILVPIDQLPAEYWVEVKEPALAEALWNSVLWQRGSMVYIRDAMNGKQCQVYRVDRLSGKTALQCTPSRCDGNIYSTPVCKVTVQAKRGMRAEDFIGINEHPAPTPVLTPGQH